MVPGEMIEWVYKSSNKPVYKGEQLWSSSMDSCILIDEPALLISITEEHYMWLNSKGLFHARVDDMRGILLPRTRPTVVPRKLKGQNCSCTYCLSELT